MTLQQSAGALFPNIQDLAQVLGADLVQRCLTKSNVLNQHVTNHDLPRVRSIASLDTARAGEISFIAQEKFFHNLYETKASFLIIPPELLPVTELELGKPESSLLGVLVSAKPYLCYAKLSQWWVRNVTDYERTCGSVEGGSIHPSAVIDPSARVDSTAKIGPLCVVEAQAAIGAHTVLKSRVTVGERCEVGEYCILHSGAVLGSDGFGFANEVGSGYLPGGAWEKIEQLGRVILGDRVEIGANVCIDRGALDDTVIEDGVKLDNLIHIAHGVRLGRNTAVAASAIFAGGAKIGENCTFGGAARIKGHVKIADNVHISADTSVIGDVPESGQYTGMFPMLAHKDWMKNAALIGQLAALRKRIQELEKKYGQ